MISKIVGERTFESNKHLTTITIPSGIIKIKEFAFRYCKAMTTFRVEPNNQHYEAENGVLFTKNKIKLIQYPLNKEDKKYTLPESTIEIEKHAFYENEKLHYITFNEQLTTIK